jgi:uncharacterized protein
MKIYVDADACPVKDIIIEEANKFHIPVILVKSYSHFSNQQELDGVETIYVDPGQDAADYRIIQLAKKHDLIITQDYGLASLGLGKGCIVIHHKGYQFTNQNIDKLLTERHISAKLRNSGVRTKGPKPFTNADKEKFRLYFSQLLYKLSFGSTSS